MKKLNKNKILKFTVQAVLYIMFCVSSTTILAISFMKNTIY
jgi:hypothetical protein